MTPFWRREPLHERLAREGGLRGTPAPPPHDVRPRWGAVAIHGIHQAREWDAIGSVTLPELAGDELEFVTLPDGAIVVDGDVPDDVLAALADAVEPGVEPPYRATAVRREAGVWAVAARAIDVVEAREVSGDEVELAVRDGERTVVVDDEPWFGSVPSLEALGRELGTFVVRASRIDGDLFEVEVSAL